MATFQFNYSELENESQLNTEQLLLLMKAREATIHAHAPYSNFHVGASVLLANGKIIAGVNIENASYPVGICAERSALASAISQFPKERIKSIAISYNSQSNKSEKPAFPCGMCRQFISECEDRNQQTIQLILAGMKGKIIIIESSKDLLPFSFGGEDLA